jgi:PadR family transcriptional regulator, regulatory protein AphA
MEPTAVTWAVLGLLALHPMSGYDIKNTVDRSIRYFWAASYGQIYPELRRLEEAGWIAGEDAANGGRTRRVYALRPVGRKALRAWLHGEETRIELRDESLLRLFFADTLPREEALGLLHARGEGYDELLGYARSIGADDALPFVDLVRRWAVDYCEWGIEWCARQERRLRRRS